MADFAVYILASQRNGTLYTGSTGNIVRRLEEHRSGVVAGFTQTHSVKLLVHLETYLTIDEARVREAALKRWRRDWKIALIEEHNPDWRDLAQDLA
ncbi:GIY-YIG nuclease family protein [Aquabacter sp. CN5-332]|uniref:GIY-YIG nuclease family protein n=1 Tax=Aquabacter sp. CN5-332 TaxID=3156608 RepID=UPI0032B3FF9F